MLSRQYLCTLLKYVYIFFLFCYLGILIIDIALNNSEFSERATLLVLIFFFLCFIISPDIDECQNPSLYSCPRGFDCANTLGSYKCVCNGRIRNGECNYKDYTRHRLNLRLKEEYTNALSNNASKQFKAIETRITSAMRKVYEKNDAYVAIEVKKMTNGSVIAEMELVFTDKNTKGISELLEAVRNNSFGDFKVEPNALTVVITGTCESHKCPGNSTCEQLTSDTISCPCNDGYYFDGASCIAFIVIKVEVALEKEFTEELTNKSSPIYQELERNITEELYKKFKDTENFEKVVVLGFRSGSVIVEFEVVYRKDANNKKIIVGETVRDQIIKTGKLGKYQVKSGVVQVRG
ncbi:Fibroblast growth factor receptor 1 [Paramuricea clavata]|uniref:Fibroblast growth factor receptor 1 n=1 Tax=Paramuricea clavata TaxID=317549 RepID=A0A6S7IAV3_PARCT|nr:Fibroblast growth factor receptor 1 [Paramuricea clavata]